MIARNKKAVILAAIGVAVNLALALIKLFVGLRTNSLCIMLDSMNGFFDTATGIVTVIALCLCSAPRTEKYPFGRGRAEYTAAFIVGAVAVVMGGLFLLDSVSRISMPEPVWFGLQSCILISVGIPIKLTMALLYRHFGKTLKSKALDAIGTDSFLDVGITAATVVSFTVSAKLNYAIDSVFGIIISITVIIFAVKSVIENLGIMSGAKSCFEEREAIVEACKKNPNISKIVKMTLHDYGYRACVGTVVVTCENKTDLQASIKQTQATLKENTGAEITFIVEEENKCKM